MVRWFHALRTLLFALILATAGVWAGPANATIPESLNPCTGTSQDIAAETFPRSRGNIRAAQSSVLKSSRVSC